MNFTSVLTDESLSPGDSLSPIDSSPESSPSSSAANSNSDNLVETIGLMQRKTTHKLSEKIRRRAINQKYEDLRMLLPDDDSFTSNDRSKLKTKQLILQHTANYIEKLKTECTSTDKLSQELISERRKNDQLAKELKAWQKKLIHLRQSKGPSQLPGKTTVTSHQATMKTHFVKHHS